MGDKIYLTYIMASARNGTVYTGFTGNPVARMWQHREKVFEASFSARYDCTLLVWYEVHEDAEFAIVREKRIKDWQRRWKVRLIEGMNPTWRDLSGDVFL